MLDRVIYEKDLKNYTGLHDLKILESREDVSTLLDIYSTLEESNIPSNQIIGVKEDNKHNYYFIVGEKRQLFSFDIVSFVTSRYTSRHVTNANIRLLFPLRLSRYNKKGTSSSRKRVQEQGLPKLFYQKKNLLITIPRDGEVILGRSEKSTNFQIKGNDNVSRIHCKLYYDERSGSVILKDCDSQNGTFVDGERITTSGVPIDVGETISIAGEKFLVVSR